MKPKVSIIIVHYRANKELFNCLSAIAQSHPKTTFEVIVVDNDVEDGIEETSGLVLVTIWVRRLQKESTSCFSTPIPSSKRKQSTDVYKR